MPIDKLPVTSFVKPTPVEREYVDFSNGHPEPRPGWTLGLDETGYYWISPEENLRAALEKAKFWQLRDDPNPIVHKANCCSPKIES